MEKLDSSVKGQGHSKGSKCLWLSVWYLLRHRTFYYQTWYGNAAPRVRVSPRKILFAVFKVKITVSAHMIKIWLFLLYLLNCWFFGNQTWSDDTSSYARLSCEKNLQSSSQQRVTVSIFVQMISSKPQKILLPNLLLWCIIMSQSVVQKDCYFQGQGHRKGSYDKNMMSFYYIFWTGDPFNTKISLKIYYHKPGSILWRNWIAVFIVKVTAQF